MHIMLINKSCKKYKYLLFEIFQKLQKIQIFIVWNFLHSIENDKNAMKISNFITGLLLNTVDILDLE